jgi:hypothetical protein
VIAIRPSGVVNTRKPVPRRDEPLLGLEAGHVQLPLDAEPAARTEEVALVVDPRITLVLHRHRATDDVQFVADGRVRHQLLEAGALPGQVPHLLIDRAPDVAERQQLAGEILRKDQQVALVVGRRLAEALHLVLKLLERLDRPDVILQGCNADSTHTSCILVRTHHLRGRRQLGHHEMPWSPGSGHWRRPLRLVERKPVNAADLLVGADGHRRCWWPGTDPLYVAYHDEEWGRPVVDDHRLFEKICLEGFQSG